MTEYRLKWLRESGSPTPEELEDSTMRRDAVMAIIERVEGVDAENVEYKLPPKRLSSDLGPIYHVGELIVENALEYYLLYEYLTRDDDNEVNGSHIDILEKARAEVAENEAEERDP